MKALLSSSVSSSDFFAKISKNSIKPTQVNFPLNISFNFFALMTGLYSTR